MNTENWSRKAKSDYAYYNVMDGYPRRKYAPDHFYTSLYFGATRVFYFCSRLSRPYKVVKQAYRDFKGDGD